MKNIMLKQFLIYLLYDNDGLKSVSYTHLTLPND